MAGSGRGAPSGNTWDREIDESGAFVRRPTSFHSKIEAADGTGFPPEPGRYLNSCSSRWSAGESRSS